MIEDGNKRDATVKDLLKVIEEMSRIHWFHAFSAFYFNVKRLPFDYYWN